MNKIVKICKIHGELTNDQILNNDRYPRCRQCKKETAARHYDKHVRQVLNKSPELKAKYRENINQKVREDRKVNREKYRKWEKTYKEKNREYTREMGVCKIYKITLEQYRELKEKSKGLCDVCHSPETRKRYSGGIMPLTVDHDHTKELGIGCVRGMICHNCNLTLGTARDSASLLRKLADYLDSHQTKDCLNEATLSNDEVCPT